MIRAPIPIAMFGAGKMGKNHIRLLQQSSRFHLAAIVDPVPVQAEPGDTPCFDSLAALDSSEIEYTAAIIASPTALHFDLAMQLVEKEKNLLIEKPICLTLEEADTLIAKAGNAGVSLFVGHVERFNPAVKKLRDVIAMGWLGEPIHAAATRVGGYPGNLGPDNNVLIDLAVHDIDVARSLFGNLRVEAGVVHQSVKPEIADTAELLLLGQSGVSISVHVNWITPTKIRQMRVTGSRGVCVVDYILQTCDLYGGNLLDSSPASQTDFQSLRTQYQTSDKISFGVKQEEPLKLELDAFADSLEGKQSDLCTAEDGRNALALAANALEHTQQNQTPFL